MKNLILIAVTLLTSAYSYASPAPANSEKYLWTIDQDNRVFTKHTCSTTKKQPSSFVVCFGEKRDAKNNLVGYALLKDPGRFGHDGRTFEEFKVKPFGKWNFLYRTTQFAYNEDFYSRKLLLIDSNGRESIITETFTYMVTQNDKIIRTSKYDGQLPNGTKIVFDNIFMFY